MEQFSMQQIVDAIVSPHIQQILLPARIIFLLVGGFFFGFLIYFLIGTPWLKHLFIWDLVELITKKPYGGKKAARFWKRIEKRIDSLSDKKLEGTIVKADRYLDKILERLVPLFQCSTFEERIERLGEPTFSQIEQVKKAHIIAKSIESGIESRISEEEKREVLRIYGKAFEDLSIFTPIKE